MRNTKRFINKSIRLREYDYSLAGAYFITICEKKRKCLFGDVVKEKMILNELGKIADECWAEIPVHFEDVELGEYIVMPNHVHGIIVLLDDIEKRVGENKAKTELRVGQTHAFDTDHSNGEDSQRHAFDLQLEKMHAKLSIIVGSYKSAVTKNKNRKISNSGFKWQTSFHDHVIRSEKEMENITNYILFNPARWSEDLENEEYRATLTDKQREKLLKEFYKNLK